ncbi:MAG: hypothetical protein R3246_11155 [Acidimicrobiia bacterium]|nr:hypothetical protein [Acidimicrobiia bacterium]
MNSWLHELRLGLRGLMFEALAVLAVTALAVIAGLVIVAIV